MGTGTFTDDFKRDAVALITERGYPAKEVSERLGVSTHSLYALIAEPLIMQFALRVAPLPLEASRAVRL